jgi:membrane-associated protease RseP (regulator of RpoE activity)
LRPVTNRLRVFARFRRASRRGRSSATRSPSRLHVFGFLHAFLLFLNLLPIPPLDGFQLLGALVEFATGRRLPEGGMRTALKLGWGLMGVWLLVNAVLIVRDLAGSVF